MAATSPSRNSSITPSVPLALPQPLQDRLLRRGAAVLACAPYSPSSPANPFHLIWVPQKGQK